MFTNTNKWSEWLKVKERLAIAIKEIVETKPLLIPKSINLRRKK